MVVSDAVEAVADAPGTARPDAFTLRGPRSFHDGHPPTNPDGTINVVVEIPAGTNAKWEAGEDGVMRLEQREGAPRIVRYLPYPGNYGLVPGTKQAEKDGGDGDALDVIVLGPTLPRGAVVPARLIGVLRMRDGGERDDKLIAVADGTPLGAARSLAALDSMAPGPREILRTWFTNYKGAEVVAFEGWVDADGAQPVLDRARRIP